MTLQSAARAITHRTAEMQFVDEVCAYRRFGRPAERPLVMLQHFRGNLDNWDPAPTVALGAERELILIDYPGVGSSERPVRSQHRRCRARHDCVRQRARLG